MSGFAINHSRRHIFRIHSERDTFDDVMEANACWTLQDNIAYIDTYTYNHIEPFLKQDYTSNLRAFEIPIYLRDPEYVVWYMDAHGFSMEDIRGALKIWEGNEKGRIAEEAIEDMLAWKEEQDNMHCEPEPDTDEELLCEKMQSAM